MNKPTYLSYFLLWVACPSVLMGQDTIPIEIPKETPMISKISDTPTKEPPSVLDFQLYVTSNYIWRDIVTDYEAIQPSTTYTLYDTGLSLNIWTSFGIKSTTHNLETSVTMSYQNEIARNISFSIGGVYYYAPADSALGVEYNTNFYEVTAGIGYTKYLNPYLQIYVNNKEEIYTILTVNETLFKKKGKYIDLSGSVAYRSNTVSIEGIPATDGFRDATLRLAAHTTLHKKAVVSFSLGTTYIIAEKTTHYQAGCNLSLQ
ncbi:hypothetical protein ACFSTE_17140 [Aquimarina hainanensis]|uniref:Uncharacterized protein n=1 Tax=Aquimarina hainanensis TaxID=1578017 RepID=A0ABW5NAC7_9FLAO